MKHTRFVPKTYGWGFVPVTRQGWLVTVCILLLVAASAYRNGLLVETVPVDPRDVVGYFLDIVLIIGVTARFCEKHTDGELKRRWGNK